MVDSFNLNDADLPVSNAADLDPNSGQLKPDLDYDWLSGLDAPTEATVSGFNFDFDSDPALDLSSPPTDVVVDARFLGRTDYDQTGAVVGYTTQYLELYQAPDASYHGLKLDVGHYDDSHQAEAQYNLLQNNLDLQPMAALHDSARQMAQGNGLDPDAWQVLTPDDLALYDTHVNSPDLDSPSASVAAQMDVTRYTAEQTKVVAALHAAGIEPAAEFSLYRDTVTDAVSAQRFVNGIFTEDLAATNSRAQAMFVGIYEDKQGMEVIPVAYGEIGSQAQVESSWSAVQSALDVTGPMAAMDEIDEIEQQRERTFSEPTRPSRTMTRDID